MSETRDKWRNELTQFIAAALDQFRTSVKEQMEQFAVDCHPWNGTIILAFLTTSEVEESPFLAEAAEMAAWKLYNFASAPELGSRMRESYEQGGNDRAKVAERFFAACAAAAADTSVQEMLSSYKLNRNFKITIRHPDTGHEYYPPR
jgi:hypothetical protein